MLNDIKLHGYLGRDPELTEHEGQNGTYKKVFFTLGVSRDYGDETDWFACTMYGKRAEVIEKYFSKGSQIIVTGRMETYKKKDETTAYVVKVTGFDFCDKASKTGKQPGAEPAPVEPRIPDSMEALEEDVPF